MLPTSLGLILPEFEPHERHVAIGVWAATGGVAAAAGPPLGGLLVQVDWRLVFLVNVPVAMGALIAGRTILVERREQAGETPDIVGAAAFIVAVTALVLAIVKAPAWGWISAPVAALVATSLLLLVAIWRRSQRHPAPLVDPAILRVRSFSLAVAASVIFFAGFAAMLLTGVLFLTGPWHRGVLEAGLMLFPGPCMAALLSVPSARLGARFGYRLPGAAGGALLALASAWWIARVHAAPAYASEYLPGMLMSGAGAGLMIPTLTGAGASSLPPERFATGAAILTMGRQVGSALGIAILVAVLGDAVGGIAAFQSAWEISLISGIGGALTIAAVRPAAAVARDPVLGLEPTV